VLNEVLLDLKSADIDVNRDDGVRRNLF
jgi:hypothetical protein